MIDALMTLAAKEMVGRVKIAAEAEQMGVGAPWENALLFWVNRVSLRSTGPADGSHLDPLRSAAAAHNKL